MVVIFIILKGFEEDNILCSIRKIKLRYVLD